MARRLEFFFDYGSPFSYLADTQLGALADRTGAEIVYRPMLLGGVFKATGNRSPAQEPVENKRAYGGLELRRTVERLGVPFAGNPHFPIDTLTIMRSCVAAQRAGVFQPFHRAVYPAFWVDGQDLGSDEVLKGILEKAGLDADRLVEAAADPDVKGQLRASSEEAVKRGAFGAPTFYVEGAMYFGCDRLPFVEEALLSLPAS